MSLESNSTEKSSDEYQARCVYYPQEDNNSDGDENHWPLRNAADAGHTDGEVIPIAVVMLVSTVCNLLMLYALYRTPHLRTVQNIFTLNLGLTDLCTSVTVLPVWMSITAMGAEPVLCTFTGFLTTTLLSVSVATIACISLDRHLSICHALQYPAEITSRRVYLMVGYVWVQGLGTASLPFFGWGKYTFRPIKAAVCAPDWRHDTGYALFMFIIALLIPFVVMFYSYSNIMQVRFALTSVDNQCTQ